VNGAIISNVEGSRFIKAKAFIDCTGDATLAALAGAECRVVTRDSDSIAPSTLCSLFGGIDWDHPAYGDGYEGTEAMKKKVKTEILHQALEDGHFTQDDRFMPGMNKIGEKVAQLNAGHVFELNALDAKELSEDRK